MESFQRSYTDRRNSSGSSHSFITLLLVTWFRCQHLYWAVTDRLRTIFLPCEIKFVSFTASFDSMTETTCSNFPISIQHEPRYGKLAVKNLVGSNCFPSWPLHNLPVTTLEILAWSHREILLYLHTNSPNLVFVTLLKFWSCGEWWNLAFRTYLIRLIEIANKVSARDASPGPWAQRRVKI